MVVEQEPWVTPLVQPLFQHQVAQPVAAEVVQHALTPLSDNLVTAVVMVGIQVPQEVELQAAQAAAAAVMPVVQVACKPSIKELPVAAVQVMLVVYQTVLPYPKEQPVLSRTLP